MAPFGERWLWNTVTASTRHPPATAATARIEARSDEELPRSLLLTRAIVRCAE